MRDGTDYIDWTVALHEGVPVLVLESHDPLFTKAVKTTKFRKFYARWSFEPEPIMDDDLTLVQKSFVVMAEPVGLLLEANYTDLVEREKVQLLITASARKAPWAIIFQFIENGKQRAVGWEITHRVRKSLEWDYWPGRLLAPQEN